jgi:hypothetical protein
MAKNTRKHEESQPEKVGRYLELTISIAFGLGVIALVSLLIYVLVTQVF